MESDHETKDADPLETIDVSLSGDQLKYRTMDLRKSEMTRN